VAEGLGAAVVAAGGAVVGTVTAVVAGTGGAVISGRAAVVAGGLAAVGAGAVVVVPPPHPLMMNAHTSRITRGIKIFFIFHSFSYFPDYCPILRSAT